MSDWLRVRTGSCIGLDFALDDLLVPGVFDMCVCLMCYRFAFGFPFSFKSSGSMSSTPTAAVVAPYSDVESDVVPAMVDVPVAVVVDLAESLEVSPVDLRVDSPVVGTARSTESVTSTVRSTLDSIVDSADADGSAASIDRVASGGRVFEARIEEGYDTAMARFLAIVEAIKTPGKPIPDTSDLPVGEVESDAEEGDEPDPDS